MPSEDYAALEARIVKLESDGGFWAGFDARIQRNPKVAALLSGLLFSAIAWATTYFSVPATRDVPVPGPETVIEKHTVKEPVTIDHKALAADVASLISGRIAPTSIPDAATKPKQ